MKLKSKLTEICRTKKLHVVERKAALSMAELEGRIAACTPPRGFKAAIDAKRKSGFALIAEIKRASPSKGLIRADFDPPAHAQAYQAGGAACLSILTDMPYFQGNDGYLEQARNACDLPCLRKDFIIDPWQVVESRALGADAILLIVAALDDAQMHEIENAALEYGMDVLIEVHSVEEFERARRLRSQLIGINNRNLQTFVTDLAVSKQLARLIPGGYTCVSESGIFTRKDCEQLAGYGIRSFLVGEALMRQDDLEIAVKKLIGHG